MKKTNFLTTSLLVLIALLIFSDGISLVVATGDYNNNEIDHRCDEDAGKYDDQALKNETLKSIDCAIAAVAGGHPNKCTYNLDSEFFAAANCTLTLSQEDCKSCLYNAQYRVVDTYCPSYYGAWLKLADCYVRYARESLFCGR
ncbi:unnamed protein product [Linum trigynum]|uniref:Gnk2-homologous domain-containing protein n=1 Tax=Linum trigynum TaxID=586398 RepID=A0AAV2E2P2_9ROSI